MGIKVCTTQLCPVWSFHTHAKAERWGEIMANQEIEVASLTPQKGDLLQVTGPANLYPNYLEHSGPGYVEGAHIMLVVTPPPAGGHTLDELYALTLAIARKVGV